MTCQDARELFSAHVDDALAPEERAGLEAHLAGCPECRRELARFEATVALLHAVEPARAPIGFVDRVLHAARPEPWYARLRRRLLSPLALRRPIEVTVLALVALTAVYLYRGSELGQLTQQYAPPAPTAEAPRGADVPAARVAPAAPPAKAAPAAPTAKKEQPAESRDAMRDFEKAPAEAPAPPASSTAPPAVAPQAPAPEAARPRVAGRVSESAPARERQTDVAEQKVKIGAAARSSEIAGSTSAPPDVSGTLAVADREAASRALAELLARLGGTQVGRRADARGALVELVVPASAYPELVEGLARIGRWQPDSQSYPLPAQVRVGLRLVAD